MEDPTEALWTLRSALDKVYYKPNNNNNGWRLSPGIKIFGPDTKAKCPNCESWITTNRIWLVDEIKAYVKGCWNRDGTKVEGIIHPHIQYNGLICLGDSGGASNALFAGVDKGRHHHSTEKWFDELGHTCPNAVRDVCIGCSLSYFSSELIDGIGCYRCFRDKIVKHCKNCGAICLVVEMTDDLCSACAEDIHYCIHCEDNRVEEPSYLCEDCQCRECGEEICVGSNYYCLDHRYVCICECGCQIRHDNEDEECGWCEEHCLSREENDNDDDEEEGK